MKKSKEIPPLCAAVKRIRALYGDSQESFARRIGVVLMTVSRFETGRAEPRDPRVLLNIAEVAFEKRKFLLEHEHDGTMIGSADSISSIDPKLGDPVRALGEDIRVLGEDEKLFRVAYEYYERAQQIDRRRVVKLESSAPPTFRSIREWRLSCAARLAVLYFPERVAAMEAAAGSAITIIDEVLRLADENQIDYVQFEGEVFRLAERRTLLELKQGRKEQ